MLQNAPELLRSFKNLAQLSNGESYLRELQGVKSDLSGIISYRADEGLLLYRGSPLAKYRNDIDGETVLIPETKGPMDFDVAEKKRLLRALAAATPIIFR